MIAARTIFVSIKWSCLKEDTWHKKTNQIVIYIFGFSFALNMQIYNVMVFVCFNAASIDNTFKWERRKSFPLAFFFLYVDNPSTICLFRLLLPPNSEHEGRRNDSSVDNDIAWRTGNVFVFPVLQEWIHPRPASCLSPLDRWTQENNK